MKHTARMLALALPGLSLSTALTAQVTGARITGVVTDSSNAAIPNASAHPNGYRYKRGHAHLRG